MNFGLPTPTPGSGPVPKKFLPWFMPWGVINFSRIENTLKN
jgi:hypothetical protein